MTTIDRAAPYAPERDLGTPAPAAPEGVDPRTVTLTIDGRQVTVPEGTSVMRAARELVTAGTFDGLADAASFRELDEVFLARLGRD